MSKHDPHLSTPSGKPRARAFSIPFDGTPGRFNAITDVPGIAVGAGKVSARLICKARGNR